MCLRLKLNLWVTLILLKRRHLRNTNLNLDNQAGISSVHYEASSSDMEVAAIAPRPKRKLGQTDLEVPDSDDDDEDYGWADEDEDALPPPPSQWQGSEDLILGENAGLTEDESEAEEVSRTDM